MSHTYGEVLPVSYGEVFKHCAGRTLFVDVGSGYGDLLRAAVGRYGCCHAIGVEKYRDKYDASVAMRDGLPEGQRRMISLFMDDINDCDLAALLAPHAFDTLLLFCNNVAFNEGTIHRSGRKFRQVMDDVLSSGGGGGGTVSAAAAAAAAAASPCGLDAGERDQQQADAAAAAGGGGSGSSGGGNSRSLVVVVSMMELQALRDRVLGMIALDTTWNKQHVSWVYQQPLLTLPAPAGPPQQAGVLHLAAALESPTPRGLLPAGAAAAAAFVGATAHVQLV